MVTLVYAYDEAIEIEIVHESHVDFWKPIFLIVDMHNYKSMIDFTLFWVLKNQYYASTGVVLGSGL